MSDQESTHTAETIAMLRDAAGGARITRKVTQTTYTLPRPIIFPGPDKAYTTREVRILLIVGNQTGEPTVEALAAPVELHPEADNDEPAVRIVGPADWMLLPPEVAPLFQPPEED